MDKNKIIILVLAVIIIVLACGLFATMSTQHKFDTKLTIKGNSTLYEGDSINVKLTDLNGTAIVNQTVNVTITDKDNASYYYSVVTNGKGIGKLKLDKSVGNYTVNCTYAGNDIYAGNSTTKKITIEEEVVEAEPVSYSSSDSSYSSSSSSSSSSRYEYDMQGGLYDTQSGKYVGGQMDGLSKEEVQEYNEAIAEEN